MREVIPDRVSSIDEIRLERKNLILAEELQLKFEYQKHLSVTLHLPPYNK
jgi:hypothetical protein